MEAARESSRFGVVRDRTIGLIAAAAVVLALFLVIETSPLRAQASTTLELLPPGGTPSSPSAQVIGLASFDAALSQISGDVLALEWPDGTGLDATTITSVDAVLTDTASRSIFLRGVVAFQGATRPAAITLDWPDSRSGPATVSIAIQLPGQVLSAVDSSLTLPGGGDVTVGTSSQPALLVIGTGGQDVSEIDGASGFFQGAPDPLAGASLTGVVDLGTIVPVVADGLTVPLSGSLEPTGSSITILNANAAGEQVALDKFSIGASVAPGQLTIPGGLDSSNWTIGIALDPATGQTAATTVATVTLSDPLIGEPLALEVGLEYNGTDPSLFGRLASGTWTNALDTGVDIEELTLEFGTLTENNATVPFIEVAGAVNSAIGAASATVRAEGDTFSAQLDFSEITVAAIVDMLENRFGDAAIGTVPTLFEGLRFDATIDFVSEPGVVSASALGSVTIDGASAQFLVGLWDDNGTKKGILAADIDDFSLGTLVPGLPGGLSDVLLPAVALRANDTPVDTSASYGNIQSFLQENFCGTPGTDCTLDQGVAMRASFPVPASLQGPLQELWIDTSQPLVLEGSADAFTGSGSNFSFSAALPPIEPPTPDDAPWLENANLAVALEKTDAGFSFELRGDMTVRITDEDRPDFTSGGVGYDRATFGVSASLSADIRTGTSTLSLVGGLQSDWNTPGGINWLTFNNLTLQLDLIVGSRTGVTVGFRGAAVLGTGPNAKDLDVSIAIGVAAGPRIDVGVRLASTAGVSLDDMLSIAEASGMSSLSTAARDALPDIAIKNVVLMVSTLDLPALCLEAGITIAGDLYIGEELAGGGPIGNPDTGACKSAEELAIERGPDCALDDDCYASAVLSVSGNGIFVDVSMSPLDLGPINITGSNGEAGPRLKLVASPTTQLLEISGAVQIPGFARVDGKIRLDGDSFEVGIYVGDDAGQNFFQVDARAALLTDTAAIEFDLDVRLVLDVQDVIDAVWNDSLGSIFTPNTTYGFQCLRLEIRDFAAGGSVGLTGEVEVSLNITENNIPKKFSAMWDFDSNVVDNVTGLVGDVFGGLQANPDGCGIPPKVDYAAVGGVDDAFVLVQIPAQGGGFGFRRADTVLSGSTVAVLPRIQFSDTSDYVATVDWGNGQTDVRNITGSLVTPFLFQESDVATLPAGVAEETRTVSVSVSKVGDPGPPVHFASQQLRVIVDTPFDLVIEDPEDNSPPRADTITENSFMRIPGISFMPAPDSGGHEVFIDWGDGNVNVDDGVFPADPQFGNRYFVVGPDPQAPLARISTAGASYPYTQALPNGEPYTITVTVVNRATSPATIVRGTTSAVVANLDPSFPNATFRTVAAGGANPAPAVFDNGVLLLPAGRNIEVDVFALDGGFVDSELWYTYSWNPATLVDLPITLTTDPLGPGSGVLAEVIGAEIDAAQVAAIDDGAIDLTITARDDAGGSASRTIPIALLSPNTVRAGSADLGQINAVGPMNEPVSSFGSPVEAAEPNQGAGLGGAVWWNFTSGFTGSIVITDEGSTTDLGGDQQTVLSVYNATTGALINRGITSADGITRVAFAAVNGTQYQVGVQAVGGTGDPESDPSLSGPIQLNLELASPPTNDDIDNAQVLAPTGGNPNFETYVINGTTVGASFEDGEPTHDAKPTADHTVWYRWDQPWRSTIDLTVSTPGQTGDTVVAVYCQTNPGNPRNGFDLVQIASDDDGGLNRDSAVRFDALCEDSTAWIAVSAYSAANQGPFTLRIDPIPVTNDEQTNATPIVGTSIVATNVATQLDPGEYGKTSIDDSHMVWFEWNVPYDDDDFFVQLESTFDARVVVVPVNGGDPFPCGLVLSSEESGECDLFDPDEPFGLFDALGLGFPPARGKQYLVGVGGVNPEDVGLFTLTIDSQNEYDVFDTTGGNSLYGTFSLYRSYNDCIFGDIPIGCGELPNFSAEMRNDNATRQPGEPLIAGQAPDATTWVEWQVLEGGVYEITATSRTGGPELAIDTVLAVYAGPVYPDNLPEAAQTQFSDLTLLAENDDASPATTDSRVIVEVPGSDAEPGAFQFHYVSVIGSGGDIGQWDLNITRVDVDHDERATPLALGSPDTALVAGVEIYDLGNDQLSATAEIDEPAHIGFSEASSLWYEWTPSVGDGIYRMAIQRDGGTVQNSDLIVDADVGLAVYDATDPDQLVPIGGGQLGDGTSFSESILVVAQGSGPYLVAVWGEIPVAHELVVIPLLDGDVSSVVPGLIGLAEPLTGFSDSATISNTDATTEERTEPDPSCWSVSSTSPDETVWFTWTAPADGNVVIDTNGSVIDTELAVWLATPTGPSEIACDDDGGTGLASLVSFDAVGGETYLLQIDGYNAADGEITVNLEQVRPPGYNALSQVCNTFFSGPLSGGDSVVIDASQQFQPFNPEESCPIPANATAVSVNVWVVEPQREGNLRIGAAGTQLQGGVLNFSADSRFSNSNSLIVPVSASGELLLEVNGGPNGEGELVVNQVNMQIVGWVGPDGPAPQQYVPVTPCTFLDSRTRNGVTPPQGNFAGPYGTFTALDAKLTETFSGQGAPTDDCGVPAGTTHALVNTVMIQTSGTGSVQNADNFALMVLNTNHSTNMNNSSATIVPVDANGRVGVNVSMANGQGDTHVRLIVLGYYAEVDGAADAGLPDNSLVFREVAPCVAFDTRTGSDEFGGIRVGGQITTYDVRGVFDPAQGGGRNTCGVPDDAEAVELNLVAVNIEREGNLRISAAGSAPTGGVLNFANVEPKLNNSTGVVAETSAAGRIDIFVNGGSFNVGEEISHIRGVITGYYTRG